MQAQVSHSLPTTPCPGLSTLCHMLVGTSGLQMLHSCPCLSSTPQIMIRESTLTLEKWNWWDVENSTVGLHSSQLNWTSWFTW